MITVVDRLEISENIFTFDSISLKRFWIFYKKIELQNPKFSKLKTKNGK